jgi:glycosyltransferase involved in cell wall biosynthesis
MNLSIPADAYCVVFFGFVLPERNVDKLIQALKLLQDAGVNVHGLILGGPHKQAPQYFTQCQELARKLLMAKHISWTGFASKDRIADGLAAADVFVSLPSRGADMRNTSIITGILAGLPIVTSENARFYVDDDLRKFGCVFVDPSDPHTISEGISSCLNNPPADELLERYAEQLEPERVWDKHIETICCAYGSERKNAR